MLPYRDTRLMQIALGLFFLVVLGYAYFEVRGLLYGPRIFVASDTIETRDRFVKIAGHADHIASITIDGAPVAVSLDGAFEIPYLLADGLNRITLDARDSYGHTASKEVRIAYLANATSSQAALAPTSTSTTSRLAPTSTASALYPATASSSTATTTKRSVRED